jgi:hypothetical protein
MKGGDTLMLCMDCPMLEECTCAYVHICILESIAKAETEQLPAMAMDDDPEENEPPF